MTHGVIISFSLVSGALLVCSVAGCGRSDFQLAEVSGRVVQSGQAKAGLSVVFQPIANSANNPNPGPASYGVTDDSGKFRLQTIDADRAGAVVGRHRVAIHVHKPETQRDGDRTNPDTAIPQHFRDGSFTIEVPAAGLPSADFDLSAARAEAH
jgi:hypothetical protein